VQEQSGILEKLDNRGKSAEAAYPLEGSPIVDMTSIFGEICCA
jgi:hypothetical protein